MPPLSPLADVLSLHLIFAVLQDLFVAVIVLLLDVFFPALLVLDDVFFDYLLLFASLHPQTLSSAYLHLAFSVRLRLPLFVVSAILIVVSNLLVITPIHAIFSAHPLSFFLLSLDSTSSALRFPFL